MLRKLLLFTTVLLLVASCSTRDEATSPDPNILIIYADDVGLGDISCYGSELINTPNIDAIAENGIRFTNAYATSGMCTPSRFSLLTGIYAFRLPGSGILSAEDPLCIEPGSFTLPEMLRQNGYRTSIVGKWHLGLGESFGSVDWNADIKPGPLEVGFDESYLLPVTNDRVPTVYVDGHRVDNLDPGDPLLVKYPDEAHHAYQEQEFGQYGAGQSDALVGDLPTGLSNPEMLRYSADVQHSGTIVNGVSRIGHMAGGKSAWWNDETMTGLFASKAKDFITRESEQPFFLFLSMHQNHVPRIPNPAFAGTSGAGLRGDAVVELDWIVGEMVRVLEEAGKLENTLIIFSSDNGPVLFDGYNDGALENHNGHDPSGGLRGGKYIAYEAATRMPTLLQWPARVKPGITSDALVSQVDLLASLTALVGGELPLSLLTDSEDLLSAWLGESKEGKEYVIQQSSDGLGIRRGNWKYIEPSERSAWAYNRHNLGAPNKMHIAMPEAGALLFNLEDDPMEMNNLAEQHPDVLSEMAALLEKVKQEFTLE
ncbi:MAG: sulfatase-like hydrolase/transferase [Bacteroidales bacterium]